MQYAELSSKTCMYRCVHENRRWMLATRAHQSVPYQSRENHHLPPLISFDNYNRSERGHRVKDSRFGFWGFYLSLMPQYQTPDIHWSKAIYLINIKPMCTSPLCQLIFVVNLTLTRRLRYESIWQQTNHQIDQNWLNIWRNWNPKIARSCNFLSGWYHAKSANDMLGRW